jgi:hypothetical protein
MAGKTFGAHQLYLAARKETGDRRSPGRPSTVNNRGEFAAVVSETRTLKALQEFSSVDPAVQIDFNQVAVSSLAKQAGVLADNAPSPFKHTWDLVPYIGTNVSDAWVAPDGCQLHCPW